VSKVCISKTTKTIFQQLIIEAESAKEHLDLQIQNAYRNLAHKKINNV
jgi:hypothetical protein